MDSYTLLLSATAIISTTLYVRVRRQLSLIDDIVSRQPQSTGGSTVAKVQKLVEHDQDREAKIGRYRDERELVFAEMKEGLIAVNAAGNIFRMNRAAFDLLGVEAREIKATPVTEVVTNDGVLNLAMRVLRERAPEEHEINLATDAESRTLNVYARILNDSKGVFLGVLLVLNDISRIKRLEQLKSDFVANVSHELKTPITSIQGFAETLLSGALRNPAEAQRFVGIILRQAERLHAIINDLLALSSLEQNREGISLSSVSLLQVVQESIEVCASKAEARQIPIRIEGADLQVRASAPLLVQAVVNLVENAIRYSGSKAPITVRLENLFGGSVRLSVIDKGCGIDARHLPRLFERFYRVDKARSRKEGGTGLGLAIVKHIMHVHGGSVGVESAPGSGSTFLLTLPQGVDS